MRYLKKAKLKPCHHLTPTPHCVWCEQSVDDNVGNLIKNGRITLEEAFKLNFEQKLYLYEN